MRKALLRNDLQSINGNSRKGTNMDNEHNEMIEKSSEQTCENSSERSCCCGTRHKKRTEEEQKALLTRLRRIEGQIRGLEKMVENGVDTFIEIGPGRTLAGFNKKIAKAIGKELTTYNVATMEDIDKVVEALK